MRIKEYNEQRKRERGRKIKLKKEKVEEKENRIKETLEFTLEE